MNSQHVVRVVFNTVSAWMTVGDYLFGTNNNRCTCCLTRRYGRSQVRERNNLRPGTDCQHQKSQKMAEDFQSGWQLTESDPAVFR